MQFTNTISLAVALLASSALSLPFGYHNSGAGAAGNACSDEGKVVCSNKQFQVCASGQWSVSMSLAEGTDCSVFGTGAQGGDGTLPPNPSTIPVSPVPVATNPAQSSEPSIPIPTSTPATTPAPEPMTQAPAAPAPATSEKADTGLGFHEPVKPQPIAASSTVIVQVPSAPATSAPSQPTQGSGDSSSGNTTPGQYQDYRGPESAYPKEDKWVSFDTMWNLNKGVCDGPQNKGKGDVIKKDIQTVAGESGVDARVILAIILQESTCLLTVGATNGGVNNPGIMQSHNGVSFVEGDDNSIMQMIKDGTMGTNEDGGEGLMQYIKSNDGLYTGLRAYNSGPNGVDKSNLFNLPAGTGTASYCSDVANRLTGAKVESQ